MCYIFRDTLLKSTYACDSAGVMYWGGAIGLVDKIETAYLNGNGRRTLLTEAFADYSAFVLHDGNIYFTDRRYTYACLFCARRGW